jgi:hypothetical protein
MKNNFFILALIAAAVGVYLLFKNQQPAGTRPATATTGSNPFAPFGNFAQGAATRGPTSTVPGTASGASIDLSGAVTAGVNALGGLARRSLDLIFGGRSTTVGSDPVIATPAPVDRTWSTMQEYYQAQSDAALLENAPNSTSSQYEHIADDTFDSSSYGSDESSYFE